MVFCFACGCEYDSSSNFCLNCGCVLVDDNFFNMNKLENFHEIANNDNIGILNENRLTKEDYEVIIKNIIDMADLSLNNLNGELNNKSILDKIKLITLSYADVSYKSRGAELGSYSFNHIKLDDRLTNSDMISTLIHELSHHLFSEIFEQILMYVFEVEKSDSLEAFVSFTLGTDMRYVLMNEYCAHTVEGRFIPHGYQNYGSFNKILHDNPILKNYKNQHLSLVMGNSIADDIIGILEHHISDKMRMEIKKEFQKEYSNPPYSSEILLETKEVFDVDDKIDIFHSILTGGMKLAINGDNDELFSKIEDGFANKF